MQGEADPGEALGPPLCTQQEPQEQSRSGRTRWAAVGDRVGGRKGKHRGQESAEEWECSGQASSLGEEKGQ